jgi:hypothetical protein
LIFGCRKERETMSAVLETSPLHGEQGELISISISVDPYHLEELLDQLSSVRFPINPELRHCCPPDESKPVMRVEFPAFSGQVQEVVRALQLTNLGGAVQLGLALPIKQ